MSTGTNPAGQSRDAGGRQQTSPGPAHGPPHDGLLPSIHQFMKGTLPEGYPSIAALAPVPSGPGSGPGPGPPPTILPSTATYASRPDIPRFSDPGREPPRPTLQTRAPLPTALSLQNGHNGQNGQQGDYRRESSPRHASDPSHHQYSNGTNGYASHPHHLPQQQQQQPPLLPPSSAPPSSGYVHYLSGQYPLPSISAPSSPRQHNSAPLHSPYRVSHEGMHHPPTHLQVQAGPGHVAPTGERSPRSTYAELLDRIKTHSQGLSQFADHFSYMEREQSGGQTIVARLPEDSDLRALTEKAYVIESCLKDIRKLVGEATTAPNERPGAGSVRHSKEMMVYEQPPRLVQQLQGQPQHPVQHPHHQHHAMQQAHMAPPPAPPLPHINGYPSLAEHKAHTNKRRGVSQDLPGHTHPRYADPPRKRAAPPGRCHSCNRQDTPEWRRGPDGARTLCNACGLHYAKLERKKASENKSAARSKPTT